MTVDSRARLLAADVGAKIKAATVSIAAAQKGVDLLRTRGIDLVNNGTGGMGDNSNFASFVFDPTDTPIGGGSFDMLVANSSPVAEDLIPVDLNKRYRYSFMAKQKVAGSKYRMYGMVVPYDISGGGVVPITYMHQAGTTTTLAADLQPGDTTITLASAANWDNTATQANSHLRSIIFWDYVDAKGKRWGTETYSRNYLADAWPAGGITGNVITLRVPWAGPAKPAGTAVSNGQSGGNYMYVGASNQIVPEEWTTYAGEVGGSMTSAETVGAAVTKFPPGTAFVRVGFLANRPDASGTQSSRHSFAAISFSDATAARAQADLALATANTAKTTADLALIAGTSAQVAGLNVIPDPGFETMSRAVNARWTYTITEKRSGGRSMVSLPSASAGAVYMDLTTSPTLVPCKAGQVWRIRVWFKTTADYNGTAGNAKLRISNQVDSIISVVPFGISTTWAMKEIIYTVPAVSPPNSLRLQMISDNTLGTIWIDDVEMVEISEALATAAAITAAQNSANSALARKTYNLGPLALMDNDYANKAKKPVEGTGQLKVMVFGDSSNDGFGQPGGPTDVGQIWTYKMAEFLRADMGLPAGGRGWIPASNGGPGEYGYAPVTMTPAGANVDDLTWQVGVPRSIWLQAGQTATFNKLRWELSAGTTSVDILVSGYTNTNMLITSAAIPAGTSKVSGDGSPLTIHRVTNPGAWIAVNPVTNGFGVLGIVEYKGDETSGIQVRNHSLAGIVTEDTYDWTNIVDGSLTPMIQNYLPDLVLLTLGSNDIDTAVDVPTFRTNVLNLHNRIKTLSPNSTIVWILRDQNVAEWPAYSDNIADVVEPQGGSVLDLRDVMRGRAYAVIADGVHYTPAGNERVARLVKSHLRV